MVKVNTELLEDRQARLVVTLEPEQVERELKAAARRIAGKVNIPGFRRGKAPYHIVRQFFGDGAIYEEALDPLGQAVYREALSEADLTPYAPGSLEDFSFQEPMSMTFTVPLLPEIDLGDYRSVRVLYEPVEITDEDVEHAILHMREEEAILEPVERPVEMGDVARLNIRGVFADGDQANGDEGAGDVFIDRKDARVKIDRDSTYPVPGFPAQIVGMAGGDSREFDITLPPDEDVDESLPGKVVKFSVSCEEVYRYELPELDDEFARTAGDFETVEELRADVRRQLERTADREASNEYASRVLNKLIDEEIVEVSYPPVMLEEQIDDMLNDFESDLKRQGLNLERYVELSQKSVEEVRKEFSETAHKRLVRSLILGRLVEVEGLSVEDEDVDDEIKTRVLSFGEQATLAQRVMDTPRMRDLLSNELLTAKAVERLALIARGEAPELAAAEGSAAETAQGEKRAASKRRRKKADEFED